MRYIFIESEDESRQFVFDTETGIEYALGKDLQIGRAGSDSVTRLYKREAEVFWTRLAFKIFEDCPGNIYSQKMIDFAVAKETGNE